MKKSLKIILAIAASIVIVFGAGMLYIKTRPIPVMEVSDIQLSNIKDGVYSGEYDSGPVKVSVEVLVKDKRITSIEILEHQNGLGKKAEEITDKIINTQSLKVEAVSGATYSSRVIIKAVEAALLKGKI